MSHPFHDYLSRNLAERLRKRFVVVLYDPRREFTPYAPPTQDGPMVSGAFFTLTNGAGAARRREGKVMKGGGTMPPNVFDQANRYGVQPDPIGYFTVPALVDFADAGGAEPDIMERWKTVAATEPNSAHRATYGLLVTIFAELTGCGDLWRAALKEWDMRESTLVNEWKAEWLAEGEAKGEAKGRAEGERSALLLVLGQKFHTPVPRDLVAAVEAQSDSAVLTRWLTIAIDADSLAAFRSAIAS